MEWLSGTVDGVQAFWVEAGRPTVDASLVFRFGMADETLPTSGWLHLVEHLALHGRETPTLQVNGSVGLLETRFDLSGPPDEVCGAFEAITGWLADPAVDGLADEARVLLAESEWRGVGPVGRALQERYGATGPGLVGYEEPGLTRVDEAALRELCARAFTRGNAALALSAAPPPGLRLLLPEGPKVALRPVTADHGVRPLAYVETRGGGVASGVVPRSNTATVLPGILQKALREQFRETEGASYAPWASYEAVDAEYAVVFAGADVRHDKLDRLLDAMNASLALLRDEEWCGRFLSETTATARQFAADPRAPEMLPLRAAHSYLRDGTWQGLDDLVAEATSATPSEVNALMDAFEASLLVGVDGDTPWEDPMPMSRMPERDKISGQTFANRDWPTEKTVLTVGTSGVAVSTDGSANSVLFDELAGVYAHGDGRRVLIGDDGWSITVEPTLWRRGGRAVEELDARVPKGLVMPFPAREADDLPRPLGLVGQMRHHAPKLRRWAIWAVVFTLAVVVAIPVASMALERDLPVAGSVAAAAAMMFFLGRLLRKRQRAAEEQAPE